MTRPQPQPARLPTEEELKDQEFEVTHLVTGPMIIATTKSGQQRYLYEGGVIPPDVPEEECDRLVDTGLVRPVKSGTFDPLDDDEMDKYHERRRKELDKESKKHERLPGEGGEVVPSKPSAGANRGDWTAYAIGQGMPEAQAKSMSRDELVTYYAAR